MHQNTGTQILTDWLKIDSPKDPSENVPQSTDWIVQPKIEWHTIQSGKPMSPHTRNENTSPDTGQRSHYMVPGGPKMLTNTLTYDKTQNNSQTLTFLHLSNTRPGWKGWVFFPAGQCWQTKTRPKICAAARFGRFPDMNRHSQCRVPPVFFTAGLWKEALHGWTITRVPPELVSLSQLTWGGGITP